MKSIRLILFFSVLISLVLAGGLCWYFCCHLDWAISWQLNGAKTESKPQGKFIFCDLMDFIFGRQSGREKKLRSPARAYFTVNEADKTVFNKRVVYSGIGDQLHSPPNYQAANYGEINPDGGIGLGRIEADLDNNSITESYQLENGRLIISEDSKIVWQSPDEWRIEGFVLADSNNDNVQEINVSLWKAGSFGSSKPFWVEENDMSIKNHFFILGFLNGEIRQLWGSSNLAEPNCEFKIADVDGDGKNDLVVIEGDYSQQSNCHGNYVAVWEWNGWGFSNYWRSDKGSFAGLEIEKIAEQVSIVVEVR
ncbi:MAG TPA: hypothetical protein PK412_01520 [bacterium]|nr:hypothetical protein [bacterium]HPN81212.1 hypothetical protein [bacterium]